MQLSFQFKLPIQIIKIGFSTVIFGEDVQERVSHQVDNWQNFGWDRESVLLGISVLIPYICSIVISLLILKVVLDKIFEYRKTLFLSTVEGERLCRIEPFSDLAQVPHALHNHISDLVRLAPASAHLQSKFKADLLKIISHFEIKERKAMPEHILWACKVKPTPSNYITDIKNYIRQVLTQGYAVLSQSDDSTSQSDDATSQSDGQNDNVLEDSGVQERFKCYMFKKIEKKYERNVGFTQITSSSDSMSHALNNVFKVTQQKCVAEKKSRWLVSVPKPSDPTPSKIFDYVVVKSCSDPRNRYCIRNVTVVDSEDKSEKLFEVDLFSLDKFEILNVAGDVDHTFSFEDPYKIDDDFINFACSNKAFDYNSTVASIKRVHNALETHVSKNSAERFVGFYRFCCPKKKVKPYPDTVNGVNFNPFQDRIILTMAAIFCESVESYRAIVSSTGLEGFCDMLIVNGSLNLSKWKVIGTIDQIMDEFHSNKLSKNEEPPGHSRIPAFLSKDANQMKITCRKSDFDGKLQQTQHSSSGVADCSLHGPASSSQDFIEATASNDLFPKTLKMIPKANGFFAKAKAWFSDAQHLFEEDIEWDPFQPGCVFEIDLNSKSSEQHPRAEVDVRFTMADKPKRKLSKNKSDNRATIELVDDNENIELVDDNENIELVDDNENPKKTVFPNCHVHFQCFQALELKVEKMCADEFEFSNPSSAMYSHQLLHAYKPRGVLNSGLSSLIHSSFCIFAVCPTLFFFVFWAYNNVNMYLIHPYWTPAAYVILFTL
jgi:hypothetical protein